MKDKIYSYKESSQKRFSQWRYKAAALVFYDIFSVALSFFIALWVLYDCKFHVIPEKYLESYIKFIGVYAIFSILIDCWLARISAICTAHFCDATRPPAQYANATNAPHAINKYFFILSPYKKRGISPRKQKTLISY